MQRYRIPSPECETPRSFRWTVLVTSGTTGAEPQRAVILLANGTIQVYDMITACTVLPAAAASGAPETSTEHADVLRLAWQAAMLHGFGGEVCFGPQNESTLLGFGDDGLDLKLVEYGGVFAQTGTLMRSHSFPSVLSSRRVNHIAACGNFVALTHVAAGFVACVSVVSYEKFAPIAVLPYGDGGDGGSTTLLSGHAFLNSITDEACKLIFFPKQGLSDLPAFKNVRLLVSSCCNSHLARPRCVHADARFDATSICSSYSTLLEPALLKLPLIYCAAGSRVYLTTMPQQPPRKTPFSLADTSNPELYNWLYTYDLSLSSSTLG